MVQRSGVIGLALLALLGGLGAGQRPPQTSPIVATVATAPFSLPLAVDTAAGRVFISGFPSSTVRVLDIVTGRLVRTVTLAQPLANPPGLLMDAQPVAEPLGRVYLLGQTQALGVPVTNTVSALNARSGRLVGVVPVPAYGTNASLAVDPRTQRVFVLTIAFPAEYVSVFDARTLHLVGRTTVSPPSALNTGWAGGGSPLVVDTRTNRVFVSHLASNSLGVLDAHDGHLLHTVTLRPADNVSNGMVQVNAPFLDERLGRVYLIDAVHDVVHTLDATRGRPLGRVVVGAFAFGLPRAVVDERTKRLFVLTHGGGSVLNALSGQLLHTITMSQTPVMGWGPSVVDEQSGRVFLSTGRSVSILDGLSGQLLHTVAVGAVALGGSPMAVDERTGHLFVASMGPVDKTGLPTGRGVVRVLDGQSGVLLHTIPVGAGPLIVVVDERARRMLVFNSGQTSRVRATAGSVTVIDLARL